MNLTIEKAKEILSKCTFKYECTDRECVESVSFIDGWNQAIDTIEKEIVSSQNPLSIDRESVLIFVRNLKVKG